MQNTRMQKEFVKALITKHFGEYHNFYVQSDSLLLADVFENLRNVCFKICKLDPGKFLSALGLGCQAA